MSETACASTREGESLTILFNNVFARRNEVLKSLELVASDVHAVSATLQGQVLQEVGVEMLFEGKIADEAHATDAAVELDALENFNLGRLARSTHHTDTNGVRERHNKRESYLLFE